MNESEGVDTREVEPALEPKFTPDELAELWKMDKSTIIRIFRDEEGVFKYCTQTSKRKRAYVTLRIPQSVAIRVWNERAR